MRTINASEFKAKCLALLDEVAETGEHIVILKHGRPVAEVVPPVPRDERFPQESLIGTGKILGDIVSPVVPAEYWKVLREPEEDHPGSSENRGRTESDAEQSDGEPEA